MLTFTRRASIEMKRRANDIMREAFDDKLGGKARRSRSASPGPARSIRSATGCCATTPNTWGSIPLSACSIARDSADLVDTVRTELGFSGKGQRFPRKDTCLAIYSYRVNTQKSLKETLETQYSWCAHFEEDIGKLLRAYVERKSQCRVLDFDDLLLYWHAMMSEDRIAKSVSAHFDHVLVDEYQDTNKLQGDILAALKPDGQGVTVVGDDAQAIYSFRAAAVENILGFPDRFRPKAEVVTLAQNFRSSQSMLDSANALMADAPRQYRKHLLSMRGQGPRPKIVTVDDLPTQAEFICTRVLASREAGIPLQAPGGVVPHRLAQRRARNRTGEAQDSFREVRRPQIPRGVARQGSARGAALGRQSAQPARRVPRAAAACRAWDRRMPSGRSINSSPTATCGARSRSSSRRPTRAWHGRSSTSCSRHSAIPNREWRGQIHMVREWYKPHMERLYEHVHMRIGDLDQLELLSSQYQTRERFVTELTLDPPHATSDLAGQPVMDEDYLVHLHRAFGQGHGVGQCLHPQRRRRQFPE